MQSKHSTTTCKHCGHTKEIVKPKIKIYCNDRELRALNHTSKLRPPKYICYKINGYWFRLNYNQWAIFLDTNPSGIARRMRCGYSAGVALRMEPIIRRQRKEKPEYSYAQQQALANS